MAFTVETGEGLEFANAYIEVAFFDEYHADRGHIAAAGLTTEVKQACIVRATDYIDKRFARKFRGVRIHHRYNLQWPRLAVQDNDGFLLAQADEIPKPLQKACAEYALRAAIYSELAPDPVLPVPTQDFTQEDLPTPADGPAPGNVVEKTEKVDVIEEVTKYSTPQKPPAGKNITSNLVASENIPEYPAADMLLEPLLTTGRRTLSRGA